MKELSIEEKAKRYDEAIEKARNIVNSINVGLIGKDSFEAVFPELIEPEDERIRKRIIHALHGDVLDMKEINEAIAWLEKQGEQKISDTDNKFIRMRETKPKDISEFLDRLTTVEQEFLWEHIAKIRKLDKEEQKPADSYCQEHCKGYQETGKCFADGECDAKRESEQKPKFEVGDSIKCKIGYLPWQKIEKIDEHGYKLRDYYTNTSSIIPINEQDEWELVEQKSVNKVKPRQEELTKFEKAVKQVMEEAIECGDTHNLKADADMLLSLAQKPAWSEEDNELLKLSFSNLIEIKDRFGAGYGEVGKCIDWLTSLKDKVQPQPKQKWKQENIDDLTDFENVMMHIGGSFFGENAGLDPNDTSAIKEQANFLLELASKQEWSEEDEEMMSSTVFYLNEFKEGYQEGAQKCISWLKSIKDGMQPKPEWSEEDEIMREQLLTYMVGKGDYRSHLYNWLESLKPQLKQEWNEEDKKKLNLALYFLNESKQNAPEEFETYDKRLSKKDYEDVVNWLKSLRPQNRWKPSEEQMKVLKEACDEHWEPDGVDPLYTLYSDLKKLRGE